MRKLGFLLFIAMSALATGEEDQASWTLMFYGACDTNCEPDMVRALGKIRDNLDQNGANFLVMLDRSPQYSDDADVFGEDFADTRLYALKNKQYHLLEHLGERNTGDPAGLQQLIRLGKTQYPAQYYGLIFFTHGDGVSFCPDATKDRLTPIEMSQALTAADSVDLMAMDVCSMAAMENAYQWRPGPNRFGANLLLASAPVSGPWPYTRITSAFKPRQTTPEQLGRLILGYLDQQLRGLPDDMAFKAYQSWALLDLRRAEAVGLAVDALKTRPSAKVDPQRITYAYDFQDPAKAPFVDLYDWLRAAGERGADVDKALTAVDAMVLESFGYTAYKHFEPGKNGVYYMADTQERGYDWRPTGGK